MNSLVSARGITTLEQFVASKMRMRPPQRIDSGESEEGTSAQLAPPDPPYKSTIGVPDPSVALVLDGKRVDYDAVADLANQPLDYTAVTLEGGKQALVISSDQSVVHARRRGRLQNPVDTTAEETLISVGLRPAVARDSFQIGVRIFTDHFFQGDSTVLSFDWYIPDLRDFDAGLGAFGGDWGDKISSLDVLGRCRWQGWEMRDRRGSSVNGGTRRELDSIGWNDNISSIETWLTST